MQKFVFNATTDEDIESARAYDKMIPWKPRLAREVPLLKEFLKEGKLLDIACATGRHSFAMEPEFQCVGIDIAPAMIQIAKELSETEKSNAVFLTMDAATSKPFQELGEYAQSFDAAIMLGNAIANTMSLKAVKRTIDNVFSLLRPGGRAVFQTVNRPEKAHYLPIRQSDGFLVQRIMIPILTNEPHNVELNVNVINSEDSSYAQQTTTPLYMLTREEFRVMAQGAGFKVVAEYKNYNKEPATDDGGTSTIWLLERPNLEFSDKTRALFNPPIADDEIRHRAIKARDKGLKIRPYRFVANFRFLKPRILSYPFELPAKNSRILDIGCAYGTDLRYLRSQGYTNLVGIDITDGFIRAGYELFGETDIQFAVGNLGGNFKTLDGEAFELEKFNYAYAGSVLHLLPHDEIPQFVKEVAKLADVFIGRTVGAEEEMHREDVLKTVLSVNNLKHILSDAGFTSIELAEIPREDATRQSDERPFKVYGFRASQEK